MSETTKGFAWVAWLALLLAAGHATDGLISGFATGLLAASIVQCVESHGRRPS